MTAKNYISTVILIGATLWAGIALAGPGCGHDHGDQSAAKSASNTVAVNADAVEDGRVMGYTSDSHGGNCGCGDKCGKSKCGCKSKCGGCGDKCGKSKCGSCGDKCGTKSKCGGCGDKCGKSKCGGCGDKCGKSKCGGCGDKCGKSKCGCGKCGHKSGKGGYDAWGVYQGSR